MRTRPSTSVSTGDSQIVPESIEGRTSEVLHFPARAGGGVAVIPHVFHRVIDTAPVSGWQVVQEQDGLHVLLSGTTEELEEVTLLDALRQALAALGAVSTYLDSACDSHSQGRQRQGAFDHLEGILQQRSERLSWLIQSRYDLSV